MERERDQEAHLSRITTEWDLVFQAHRGLPDEVSMAQVELMGRYAGAVHRYLLGALRDPDAAAELDQEFALRFLRGDFHRADPNRGRFRDFLKRSLRNLMIDHWRREGRDRARSLEDAPEPSAPGSAPDEFDRQFLKSWRRDLMARAWAALAEHQEKTGRPFHLILRFRVDHPELNSPQMAERLSARLGKPVGAVWVRQCLHQARERFINFLLDEVIASLRDPTPEEIELELGELGLLEYCRAALERRRGGQAERQ